MTPFDGCFIIKIDVVSADSIGVNLTSVCLVLFRSMAEIKSKEVYTTKEVQNFLKISESTLKRMIKSGIITAYKVGGVYRIWGDEILGLLSPKTGEKIYNIYHRIKEKTKKTIEKW